MELFNQYVNTDDLYFTTQAVTNTTATIDTA